MIKKQRSGGLIAPRRRTEHDSQAPEHSATGGVPVISRLPSLAAAKPPSAGAPANVAGVVERRRSIVTEPVAVEPSHAEVDPTSSLSDAGEGVAEHRPLLAAITTFPWNNLLLGVGLAGLLILGALAVSRSRPAVVAPPSPPTVHYHITPPQQADSAVVDAEFGGTSPAPGPSLPKGKSKLEKTVSPDFSPRIARHTADDRSAFTWQDARGIRQDAAAPGDESPLVERDAQACASAGEYPATDFPDLPLPPRTRLGTATQGARLTGNIEKFKK